MLGWVGYRPVSAWFRVPLERPPAERVDPFVPAALLAAVASGQPLEVPPDTRKRYPASTSRLLLACEQRPDHATELPWPGSITHGANPGTMLGRAQAQGSRPRAAVGSDSIREWFDARPGASRRGHCFVGSHRERDEALSGGGPT